MKSSVRFTSFALALVFLALTLVACNDTVVSDTTPAVTTAPITENPVVTEPPATEEKPDLPEVLNYDGYEFMVYSAGNVAYQDFGFTDEASTVVESAQYLRQSQVEELLDIVFNSYIYDVGYYYQIGTYNLSIMSLFAAHGTSFSTMYNSYERPANAKLKLINNNFKKVLEDWQ